MDVEDLNNQRRGPDLVDESSSRTHGDHTPEGEIQIDTLSDDRIAEAADVLARSFSDDPSHRALFPNEATRTRILRQEFTAACRAVHDLGEIYSASRGDTICGVAIWIPPEEFPFSPRRQLRTIPNLVRILTVAPRSFRRYVQLSSGLGELHPEQPYWYLLAVGVEPGSQGQRIGTKLLEPILTCADETDQSCYLETASERNVEWYRKLGFEVRCGEVPVTPWGPPYWTMHREAEIIQTE